MRLNVENFWQKAGAIVVKNYGGNSVVITNNKLETALTKDQIFSRVLNDMLNKNDKPWEGHIRPFLKQYTKPGQLKRFLEETEPGEKTCSYCGRKVKKLDTESLITDPLSVKADNFMNFYGFGLGHKSVCSDCQFLGILAPLALFYTGTFQNQTNTYNYVLPESTTLEKTHKAYLWMREVESVNPLSNIKLSCKFYPTLPYETLLLALKELFKRSGFIPNCKYHVFQIQVKGRSTDVLTNDVFNSADYLKEFFNEIEEAKGKLGILLDSFITRDNGGISTLLREKLSKKILKREDVESFIEMALFEIGRYVPGMNSFLKSYLKVRGENMDILEICKKTGEGVGNAVFEKESFGDLYSLRNSKSVDGFMDALSMLSVKYAKENWTIRLPEDFLKIVSVEEYWKKAKSLMVIFAVNKYLEREFARQSKNGGEE
ncbi:MAG: hypothetical protein ACP5D6_08825 [Kosmotogaceae bacterium]